VLSPIVCAKAPFVRFQNDKIIGPAFWVENPIKIAVGEKKVCYREKQNTGTLRDG